MPLEEPHFGGECVERLAALLGDDRRALATLGFLEEGVRGGVEGFQRGKLFERSAPRGPPVSWASNRCSYKAPYDTGISSRAFFPFSGVSATIATETRRNLWTRYG
ncbi:MAG: hypothetical protein LBP19_06350 [Treponema sp.]|nr:hypothetical protein [Treponema sp.]